ncbi:hypothetical protein G9L00_004268 [Salmonella enterica subsp. enterica serovar Ohio]|nr:hypothetical protein [Salmonella enterica subsp. enterica serovar Ohio]
MSKKNRNVVDKISESRAINLVLPIKKPKDRFQEAFKFKNAKAIMKMAKLKQVDYEPFEIICERNDITEKELAKRYRFSSVFALIALIAFFGWSGYGIFALILKGDVIAFINCLATSFACAGIYFWNAVEAYCFRTRQTYSKLSFLSSIEHIIPNPFHDFAQVSVVEKEGKVAKKLNAFLLSRED